MSAKGEVRWATGYSSLGSHRSALKKELGLKTQQLLIALGSLFVVFFSLFLVGNWQGTAANAPVQVPMFYDEHYLFPRPWTQFQAAPGVPEPAPVALHGSNRLSQPFVPGMDYLNLVTFMAQGTEQRLEVALRDDHGRVWRHFVQLETESQPTAVRLTFDPIPNSAGRTYWLTLTAPEATPDNPVLLFTTGGDRLGGSLRLNEFPRPGNLDLQTYAAGMGAGEALREQMLPTLFALRLQQYKVFKDSAFGFLLAGTAVLSFLLIIIAHPAVLNGYKWREFLRVSGWGVVILGGVFLSWQLLAGRVLVWPTAVTLMPSENPLTLAPPAGDERLIYDLSQQLWTAERVPDERFVTTTPAGITVPLASALRYNLLLPAEARLTGAVQALPLLGAGIESNTAVVRVNGQDIWSVDLRPSLPPAPFDLDLSPWAGQAVSLELVVLGEPSMADQRPAVMRWQLPQISTAASWLEPYAESAQPTLWAFAPPDGQAGWLDLLDITFDRESYQAGDTAVVEISWHTAVKTDAYPTLFMHLLDEEGELLAQVDAAAGPLGYPAAAWPLTMVVRDARPFQLPADLPAGEYVLAVGLYDVGSGVRWLVEAEMGQEGGEHGRVFAPQPLIIEE